MLQYPDTVCALWLREKHEFKKVYLFENVKVVWADFQGIKKIPDEFMDCTRLESIELISNKLRKLPKDFGKLKNLEALDLTANKLKCLPESFEELKNLTYLNLSWNNIKSCDVLLKLKNLKTLYIHGNPLDPEFLIQLRKTLPDCVISADD